MSTVSRRSRKNGISTAATSENDSSFHSIETPQTSSDTGFDGVLHTPTPHPHPALLSTNPTTASPPTRSAARSLPIPSNEDDRGSAFGRSGAAGSRPFRHSDASPSPDVQSGSTQKTNVPPLTTLNLQVSTLQKSENSLFFSPLANPLAAPLFPQSSAQSSSATVSGAANEQPKSACSEDQKEEEPSLHSSNPEEPLATALEPAAAPQCSSPPPPVFTLGPTSAEEENESEASNAPGPDRPHYLACPLRTDTEARRTPFVAINGRTMRSRTRISSFEGEPLEEKEEEDEEEEEEEDEDEEVVEVFVEAPSAEKDDEPVAIVSLPTSNPITIPKPRSSTFMRHSDYEPRVHKSHSAGLRAVPSFPNSPDASSMFYSNALSSRRLSHGYIADELRHQMTDGVDSGNHQLTASESRDLNLSVSPYDARRRSVTDPRAFHFNLATSPSLARGLGYAFPSSPAFWGRGSGLSPVPQSFSVPPSRWNSKEQLDEDSHLHQNTLRSPNEDPSGSTSAPPFGQTPPDPHRTQALQVQACQRDLSAGNAPSEGNPASTSDRNPLYSSMKSISDSMDSLSSTQHSALPTPNKQKQMRRLSVNTSSIK